MNYRFLLISGVSFSWVLLCLNLRVTLVHRFGQEARNHGTSVGRWCGLLCLAVVPEIRQCSLSELQA